MGLAERRASLSFQERFYPPLKAAIDRAAGFEVAMDVRWDQIAVDDYAHLYDTAWPKLYFMPLEDAFKRICIDDLGRQALREGLKRVMIQNTTKNFSSSYWANFDKRSGVLVLEHDLSNVDDHADRTEALVKVLEKDL